MQALYNDVQVNLNSVATATSTDVTLKDGQAVVDVTGKANDVFRRVQVRLPLKGTGTATNSTSAGSGFAPSFAILSADSLCKRLAVGPVTTVDSAGIPAGADASCKLD
jgi:hypothetical protein